jgi:hypothetical protein
MASAGIRMAPTGRYKVWWRLDDASQGSQTFDTRDQARDFKHDLLARLARELAVRHLTADDGEDDKKLLAEQVAGSVAKYGTKATEALGVTLDHRIGEAELKDLDLPAHVAELVRAWWSWAPGPVLESCRCGSGRTCLASVAILDQEPPLLHHLGGAAAGRVTYAIRRRRRGQTLPLDAWGRRRMTRP